MATFEFGINAVSKNVLPGESFVVYDQSMGGNYNPYNKAYFNSPQNIYVCKSAGRITSIPSPYARMHITDLAFQEYNCCRKGNLGNIAADYKRAMSHCLDLFELLFHADEFNFVEKGISIKKIELVSTNSQTPDVLKVLYTDISKKTLTPVGRYIQTLDLFREQYSEVITKKTTLPYHFDFTSLYIFKYGGKTFASTSPFTGFAARCDCNLDDANVTINGHKVLSADPTSWVLLNDRDFELRKFMYLLFKDTALKFIFSNLYQALESSFSASEKTQLDNANFCKISDYSKFNIDGGRLQKVKGQNVFIRPEGIDCSYIKYLLYLAPPVDLSITSSDYGSLLDERKFDGVITPWIGANDILTDSLFRLTYDINDNYIVVPFVDMTTDGKPKRRLLLPIKREALQFFSIDELVDNMTIVHRDAETYAIALTIHLENGGTCVLRREYKMTAPSFPNGCIVDGDEMKPFAFGIYPFVRSSVNQNIYKVLFYNNFNPESYAIKFYKRMDDESIAAFLDTECKTNRTNDRKRNAEELPVNCEYHHLESPEGFEFAEVAVKGKGSSLIVPRMRSVHTINEDVTVAIDLGTSNTYIAYVTQKQGSDEAADPREICTHHGGWNELTFMNTRCEKTDDPNAPEKNREDLYLKVTDERGARPSDEWLDSQLCEFIPSRIDPSMGDESYCFPIPSVINFLRIEGQRSNVDKSKEYIPLLHTAIPFAYYERGTRRGQQKNYFDNICNGNSFKWFVTKSEEGDIKINDYNEACFKAFVKELLFIVRSHLVSEGYNLQNTKLLWSYPLSFDTNLVTAYITTWNEAYREIINPDVSASQVDQFVHYTNESRSPIFECITPSTVEQLTLLVDIGGGSTDVIGYKDRKPLFITSFGFAGDALYLDSPLTHVDSSSMKHTVLYKYIKDLDIFKPNSGRTQPISMDAPMSTLMNYGFKKDPVRFNMLFSNERLKFMLLFHNAAIFYHIAQLCKKMAPGEAPIRIFLTGNGSNLLKLNRDYEPMLKDIFKYVLDESLAYDIEEMKIRKPDNPKAATAKGALVGYVNGWLATNNAARTNRIVMLGDESTTYEVRPSDNGARLDYAGDYRDEVMKNVEKFVEMFYDIIYTTTRPAIGKERIINALPKYARPRAVQNNELSDSLFFESIAKLMTKISEDLALDMN